VEFTAALLRGMQQAHVPRLLHMSALNADAERGGSHYLRSKGQAEQLVRSAAGLEWTVFRPSVIFGANDSLTRRFAALLRLTAGVLPLARPNARFAPIYVGDVVEAFMRALHGGATVGATYELCGPDVLTLAQLVRLTAEAAQLPCHLLPLPDALARLQGLIMDFVPGKPFSSDNYRSLLTDSLCHDNGCERLGLQPARFTAWAPLWLRPPPRLLD
jgi:NADH dehydrogenase